MLNKKAVFAEFLQEWPFELRNYELEMQTAHLAQDEKTRKAKKR